MVISKEISKKVLSVGPVYNPPFGGIAQLLYNYSQDGFENFRVVVNSGGKEWRRKSYFLVTGFIKFLILMTFDWRIRIVHIHTASNNSFLRSSIYILISKIFFKKVILHIHSGDFFNYFNKKKKFVNRILKLCDIIIMLTDMWKQMLIDATDFKNIRVLGNIIPKPQITDERYNDGLIHILFMARITEAKGAFDLMNAVNDNRDSLQGKVVFHIAGKGEVDELERLVNEYNVSHIVKFEGWISGEEKISLLNKCDIFILPTHFEALSLSILEAMSYRKPIIATNVGGIPSIVKHGYNGFLHEKGDNKCMVNHINYFINNPEKINEMGNNSERIISNYYSESIIPKLQEIYLSLL